MISMLDLKKQYQSIKGQVDPAVIEVFTSGKFILGEYVEKFEKEAQDYLHVNRAIGLNSGTDALRIALVACGIKKGDEVITTPFTFFATTEVISELGAVPVFADIESSTFNIDPEKIKKAVTSKTRAVIPVHLFGQSCDMDKIMAIAKEHDLKVIEDCAQSWGADYKGVMTGTIGDAGCYSFFPTKNLGGYGDGGMVVTNNPGTADLCRVLRVHGGKIKYHHDILGYNSRLDAVQAVILSIKLKYVNSWNERRRFIAHRYSSLIRNPHITVPPENKYGRHVYHQYTIKCADRDLFVKFMKNEGISTMVYYPVSLHLQEVYKDLGYKKGDLPVCEKAQKEVVSLPIYPELTQEEIDLIIEKINSFKP